MAIPDMLPGGGGRGGLNLMLAGGLPGGGSIQDLIAQLQGRLGGGSPPGRVTGPPMLGGPPDQGRDFGANFPPSLGPPISGRPVPLDNGRGAGPMPFKLPEVEASPPQGAPEPPAPPEALGPPDQGGAPAGPMGGLQSRPPPGGTDDDFRRVAEPRAPSGPRQAPVRSPAPPRPTLAQKPAQKPGGGATIGDAEAGGTPRPFPQPGGGGAGGGLGRYLPGGGRMQTGMKAGRILPGGGIESGGFVNGEWRPNPGQGGEQPQKVTGPGLQSGPPPPGGFGEGPQLSQKPAQVPGGGRMYLGRNVPPEAPPAGTPMLSGLPPKGGGPPNVLSHRPTLAPPPGTPLSALPGAGPGGGNGFDPTSWAEQNMPDWMRQRGISPQQALEWAQRNPDRQFGQNLQEAQGGGEPGRVTGPGLQAPGQAEIWMAQNMPRWMKEKGVSVEAALNFVQKNPDSPLAQQLAAAGLG